MRTGRLSRSDWDYINSHSETLSPEKIAENLGRSVESVENHLKKIGKSFNKHEAFATQAEYDIKARPYWRELKAQFSEEELIRVIGDYDGWIIGDDPCTRSVIAKGKEGKLRALVKWGIGVDNVDFGACKEFDIPISNTDRKSVV